MPNQELINFLDQLTPYFIVGLIGFMALVVISLAKESKGGRAAYIVLSIALLIGCSGWIAKTLIQYFLGI
jgi:hypothetical protein